MELAASSSAMRTLLPSRLYLLALSDATDGFVDAADSDNDGDADCSTNDDDGDGVEDEDPAGSRTPMATVCRWSGRLPTA